MSQCLVHCSAYDKAAIKMRGSRAALNFPGTDYSKDSFMKVLSMNASLGFVVMDIAIEAPRSQCICCAYAAPEHSLCP